VALKVEPARMETLKVEEEEKVRREECSRGPELGK
jgi:hypothetical protein